MVRSRHSESAEFLNVLNDQVITSMDFFFPEGSGIFQDDNAKIKSGSSCERVEHEESFSHIHWPPQSPDFTPLKVIEMCWKRLKEWFDSCHATLNGIKCRDIA